MNLIQSVIHKGFLIERKYLFDRLPQKILLVRHGQSEENLDLGDIGPVRGYTSLCATKNVLTLK